MIKTAIQVIKSHIKERINLLENYKKQYTSLANSANDKKLEIERLEAEVKHYKKAIIILEKDDETN